MKFVKRFLPLLAIVALVLASCATQAGQVPKEAETPPPVAESGPQEPQLQPEVEVEKPSVEKSELQSLFGQANDLKDEAIKFGLDSILSDKFQEANKKHEIVSTEYKDLVETPDQYDGVKAYPLKDELTEVVSMWEELIEEGSLICPELVKMERSGADLMRSIAIDADAPMMAPSQYDFGLRCYSQAEIYTEDSRFLDAIVSYKLASAAFENSAAAAEVNKLKENIEKNGYSSYESIQMFLTMAEEKCKEAEDLWLKGNIDDIAASTALLKEAREYYSEVYSKGSNFKALEAKDKAIAAQDEAIKVNADINAPDEYQNALDIFAEAEKSMEEAEYVIAYSSYVDAATAFEAARDISQAMVFDAAEAIAEAETKLADARDRASELGLEENIYLIEANLHLDNAKTLEKELKYSAAIFETNEVSNYIGLSDSFVQQEAEIREKARLEQLERDKAAAEAAIADAKVRMTWAEEVDLKSDYPKQYTDASNAMIAAEKAYQIEKYSSAKTLAEEVSATLSDDFQKQVLAARELEKIKAAEAEEASRLKAVAKQAADAAIADAESRMAWANENQIRAEYAQEYQNASVAMVSAYVAYGNEDYLLSKQKAEEVSVILSNDFQAQVAAERAAKAQLAADKAIADEVMPKAQDRIEWADLNNIKADYPEVYNSAHSAMEAAQKAYQIEKYAAATQLANEVLSTLSSEFEAKVTADRAEKTRLAAEAKAKEEAEKEAQAMAIEIQKASNAAEALGIAHSRMSWAVQANLASVYPDEFRDADTSMQAADKAYSEKAYDASIALANDVVRIISDDLMAEVNALREAEAQLAADKAIADEVMPKAQDRIEWADLNDIKADYPEVYNSAHSAMEAAQKAYQIEKYAAATQLANEVLSTLSSEFEAKVTADRAEKARLAAEAKAKEEAEKEAQALIAQNKKYAEVAISDARSRYDWAASKNAANNYPDLFKEGGNLLADAQTAFNALDYVRAKDLAAQAYWTLMEISEFAPLPATYKVRLIPERRDCLWRIAEYQFVYNNPYKWPVLYEANKKTFKDPSNPNLIFPDQVLTIPSIKGEVRQGAWDPKKTYQPLPK